MMTKDRRPRAAFRSVRRQRSSIQVKVMKPPATAAPADGFYRVTDSVEVQVDADEALAGALDELAVLGTGEDRERIAVLRDRLDAARLRVLVAGEAKRGKSTLINALLGCAVLPTGVTPLTAVATTVRYGDDPHAEVRFADGHQEKQPLSALPDLVTERGNPANRRRIAAATVYLDAPLLADGVELVDTPGTGSVFAWDTAAAHGRSRRTPAGQERCRTTRGLSQRRAARSLTR